MTIGGGTVIVIEDDEGMREAIESLLGAAGLATAVYASAEAFLAGDAPDARCIVSDLRLPAMSGLELLAELRRRGACPPVILVTAHDSPVARTQALRCGAAAYLPKPFAGTALLEAIEHAAR